MTKDETLKMLLVYFELWNHNDSIFYGEFDYQINAIKEALAQTDYKSTSDYQFMENVQGELERIKLVQTGVGIEQRAEEAYEAAKHRSWVGVSDEVAQPEQDWIERERAVGYREGHMAALAQRKWVGLTDAEVKKIVGSDRYTDLLLEVVNFVEAKLKEKNCG